MAWSVPMQVTVTGPNSRLEVTELAEFFYTRV